jgi:hypothetical protein
MMKAKSISIITRIAIRNFTIPWQEKAVLIEKFLIYKVRLIIP